MDLDAFAAALRDGLEKERALRWDEAATLYADLVRKAPDPASRALALLRHGRLGGRRGRLGGAGPAPAGDPRRRPLAGGPRGGRPLLRPRRNEGEGGPTARAPRTKTGLNDSGRKAAAPSFTALHPTFQMSRTPLDTRSPWPWPRSTCSSSGNRTMASPRCKVSSSKLTPGKSSVSSGRTAPARRRA